MELPVQVYTNFSCILTFSNYKCYSLLRVVFCDPSCGTNAECILSGNISSCVCGTGYTGDGLSDCQGKKR